MGLRPWQGAFSVALVTLFVFFFVLCMSHTCSPAAAALRRSRALARGFLVEVETDSRLILVPAPVAKRTKAIAASLATHRAHELLGGVHFHHASHGASFVRQRLPQEQYLHDLGLHRAANSARHRRWARVESPPAEDAPVADFDAQGVGKGAGVAELLPGPSTCCGAVAEFLVTDVAQTHDQGTDLRVRVMELERLNGILAEEIDDWRKCWTWMCEDLEQDTDTAESPDLERLVSLSMDEPEETNDCAKLDDLFLAPSDSSVNTLLHGECSAKSGEAVTAAASDAYDEQSEPDLPRHWASRSDATDKMNEHAVRFDALAAANAATLSAKELILAEVKTLVMTSSEIMVRLSTTKCAELISSISEKTFDQQKDMVSMRSDLARSEKTVESIALRLTDLSLSHDRLSAKVFDTLTRVGECGIGLSSPSGPVAGGPNEAASEQNDSAELFDMVLVPSDVIAISHDIKEMPTFPADLPLETEFGQLAFLTLQEEVNALRKELAAHNDDAAALCSPVSVIKVQLVSEVKLLVTEIGTQMHKLTTGECAQMIGSVTENVAGLQKAQLALRDQLRDELSSGLALMRDRSTTIAEAAARSERRLAELSVSQDLSAAKFHDAIGRLQKFTDAHTAETKPFHSVRLHELDSLSKRVARSEALLAPVSYLMMDPVPTETRVHGAEAVAAVSHDGLVAAGFLSSWLSFAPMDQTLPTVARQAAAADTLEEEYWENLYTQRDEEMKDCENILHAENDFLDASPPADQLETARTEVNANTKLRQHIWNAEAAIFVMPTETTAVTSPPPDFVLWVQKLSRDFELNPLAESALLNLSCEGRCGLMATEAALRLTLRGMPDLQTRSQRVLWLTKVLEDDGHAEIGPPRATDDGNT